MSYVDRIIAKFGGLRPMARAIGRAPQTVHSWRVVGRIPAQHQAGVLATARDLGLDVTPVSFFPPSDTAAAESANSASGGPSGAVAHG